MHSYSCLLTGALWLALATSVFAASYEVAQESPQAADTNPGTPERPWKTMARAAEMVGPGDRIVIRGGVYRERVLVKASGNARAPIVFEAAPGESVVMTGADPLTGWRKLGRDQPIYSVSWPHQFIPWNQSMTHPGDEYHRLIGRCEQVVVNGYFLHQVLSSNQLGPGSFLVDIPQQALFVWDLGSRDLNQVHVEASVRQEVLRIEGDYVQVRGIHFRYAANRAQQAAVILAGRHDRLEDCVVEAMNSSGASFQGEDAVVRRCTFRDNGQLGFGAGRAHRLLFTECLVENNNTKGFDRGWEAGGNKLALCRDVILERSQFVRNRGNGIWFDIGNTNCTVRHCLIADNEDAGIFYEISFGLWARDNVIVGNGFAHNPGGWGAQAGISLSSSPGCVIERNLIYGNREGFNFREQFRTTPTIEDPAERAVWNHDQLIRHNWLVLNRDAQVWGWFDMNDNRHWPGSTAAAGAGQSAAGVKPGDIARLYVSTNTAGQPTGLTLEALHLQFEDNIYFAAPGRGWFKWGTTWARHKTYANLTEFQSDLGIDRESQVIAPRFADPIQRDFRLPADDLSRLEAAYPRGRVPGVHLGVWDPSQATAPTRSAAVDDIRPGPR